MYDRSAAAAAAATGGGGGGGVDHEEEMVAAAFFANAGGGGGGGGGGVMGLEALSGDFGRLLAAEGGERGEGLQGQGQQMLGCE
jgi:hypothetical protein